MSDWSAGYVADVGYTYGYYPELNPGRARLELLQSGFACPEFGTACELGFGQGVGTNMHACATMTKWYGTDFNPEHASFAQELASVSGNEARVFDESFAEFCSRDDLPDFDFIGLHGIWSWISDENRQIITDFIRRKLKVGGVMYISYNTLPGWAPFVPMRHLLTQHAEVLGTQGQGIISRIDNAIEFADQLIKTHPKYSKANPQVLEKVTSLKQQSRSYLAHEYFNRDWQPMHFSEMAQWLEPAKVQFAGSASYMEKVDALNLSLEQQELLAVIPDPMFKEGVRDFMVNQQFRRDYWVKGARKLTILEQAVQLREEQVMLVSVRDKVSLKVRGAAGDADMKAEVYNPLLEFLGDYQPKSLGQLETLLVGLGQNFSVVLQAVNILIGSGHLATVESAKVSDANKRKCDKLNAYLMSRARSSSDINYLVSPVTGSGINTDRITLLIITALKEGHKQPGECAAFVWNILNSLGQKLVIEGKTLDTAEENLAKIEGQAKEFIEGSMAIYKALKII